MQIVELGHPLATTYGYVTDAIFSVTVDTSSSVGGVRSAYMQTGVKRFRPLSKRGHLLAEHIYGSSITHMSPRHSDSCRGGASNRSPSAVIGGSAQGARSDPVPPASILIAYEVPVPGSTA